MAPPSRLRCRNDWVVENPKIWLSYTVPSGPTTLLGSVPRRNGSATVSRVGVMPLVGYFGSAPFFLLVSTSLPT